MPVDPDKMEIGQASNEAGAGNDGACAADAAGRAVAALQAALAATHYPMQLYDGFDRDKRLWDTGTSNDDLSTGKQEIAQGKYRWQARALDSFSWWSSPDMENTTDFYLTVEVRQVQGPEDAECGVIFRAQDDDAYGLSLRANGQCAAFRDYGDEHKTLLDWRPAPVLAGQANRLTVVGQGSHFILLVNDQYVGEFDDDALPEGKVGLMIGLNHPDDAATFEFDDFELRTPD